MFQKHTVKILHHAKSVTISLNSWIIHSTFFTNDQMDVAMKNNQLQEPVRLYLYFFILHHHKCAKYLLNCTQVRKAVKSRISYVCGVTYENHNMKLWCGSVSVSHSYFILSKPSSECFMAAKIRIR